MTKKKYIPLDLGSAIRSRVDYLAHNADWPVVDRLLQALSQPQSIENVIQAVHVLQRLYLVHALGLQNNESIIDALNVENHFPWWLDYAVLKATEAQKDKLAYLMLHGDPEMRSPISLTVCDYSRDVAERVVRQIMERGDEVDLWIEDLYFQQRILNVATEEQASAFGILMVMRALEGERNIGFRANNTSREITDPPIPAAMNKAFMDSYSEKRSHHIGDKFYTITALPTPQDAVLDNIPYDEYVDLFFRMCDLDWDRMGVAHEVLIKKLNAGKILRITNNDGTDVSMDIEGFTFCNSRVAKNVPGSEVFSAPRIDSVNGRIVAKGRFVPKVSRQMIEDIILKIKDGRIVHYEARIGQEHLRDMIETDEGSHYFGEIGIGTNPVLQQHVTNGLLVEKIGGSFHLAIGAAYQYKDYLGTPVHLDNGNRSKVHWDITTMLVGKEGKMVLDGEVIMLDGKFTGPLLSYLNGK